MAHFAKIENGIVSQVVVVDDSEELRGQEYLNSLGLEGTWVQTSYNANFGKKFAGIGDSYNAETTEFKPEKPYVSWVWDEIKWTWLPPTPRPTDANAYAWNEESLGWVIL